MAGDRAQRLPPSTDWKQFIFHPPLPVAHVVTAGISSCAGGVTITTEDTPEHIWLWHIDGSVPIPLKEDLARLWPDPRNVPDLRSVVVINPSPWEINKYRPPNLYPAAALGRCQTVYLARSCHFYAQYPVVAGCDLFGVDVSAAAPGLVFTYDFDKRTEPLTPASGATAVDLPSLLIDFTDNLYGAYRDGDAVVNDPATMGRYLAGATTNNRDARVAIKGRMIAGASKSCRVPGFNDTAFQALARQCRSLLETPCFHVGEKGDLEMAHGRTIRWMPGSFED